MRVGKSSQDSKIGLSSLAEMNRLADQIFQNESATKNPRFSQPNRALVERPHFSLFSAIYWPKLPAERGRNSFLAEMRSNTTFWELLVLEASAVGVDRDVLHQLLHEPVPAAGVVAVGLDVGDGREVALSPQSALLGNVDQEFGP